MAHTQHWHRRIAPSLHHNTETLHTTGGREHAVVHCRRLGSPHAVNALASCAIKLRASMKPTALYEHMPRSGLHHTNTMFVVWALRPPKSAEAPHASELSERQTLDNASCETHHSVATISGPGGQHRRKERRARAHYHTTIFVVGELGRPIAAKRNQAKSPPQPHRGIALFMHTCQPPGMDLRDSRTAMGRHNSEISSGRSEAGKEQDDGAERDPCYASILKEHCESHAHIPACTWRICLAPRRVAGKHSSTGGARTSDMRARGEGYSPVVTRAVPRMHFWGNAEISVAS